MISAIQLSSITDELQQNPRTITMCADGVHGYIGITAQRRGNNSRPEPEDRDGYDKLTDFFRSEL